MHTILYVFFAFLCVSTAEKCRTPDGYDGTCIPLNDCETLRTYHAYKEQVIEETEELIQNATSACHQSNGNSAIVCCHNIVKQAVAHVDILTNKEYSLPDLNTCGKSISDTQQQRIVKGFTVKDGQFPWMAVLGYGDVMDYYNIDWKCGAALITPAHVLTAAHCMKDDLVKVRTGLTNIWNIPEAEGEVLARYPHEHFNTSSFVNDIAILKVQWDNPMPTPNIAFICLPITDDQRQKQYIGYYPFVTGWGLTSYQGDRSDDLMGLQVPVISNPECVKTIKKFSKLKVVTDHQICAGYKKTEKDSCQGDSGGPLAIPQLMPSGITQYYQVGVVSWGHKCAVKGVPGVYTRVSEYIGWIQTKINA